MRNNLAIAGTLLVLAATSALGADRGSYPSGELYREGETSLDVYGTASLGRYTLDHLSGSRIRHNTRLGAGIGLNYFFTQMIGVSADVYSENTSGAAIDSASANLVLRFPLGSSGFAPYALGGGGHRFDGAEAWFAQFGGGMEYRFTRNIGAFFDARWVIPDETKYYGVARLGLRFAF